jgi:hypothetical protein
VDKFGANLFSVGRVLFPISYSKKPRQRWRGFRFPHNFTGKQRSPG